MGKRQNRFRTKVHIYVRALYSIYLWPGAGAGLKMNYDSIRFILGGYKEIYVDTKMSGQPNPIEVL